MAIILLYIRFVRLTTSLGMSMTLGPLIIKIITAIIYCFLNKLEYFSLNARLGWKGLQGTNTLAYYGNRKFTAVISFMIALGSGIS
jgi:hypothetical protein